MGLRAEKEESRVFPWAVEPCLLYREAEQAKDRLEGGGSDIWNPSRGWHVCILQEPSSFAL